MEKKNNEREREEKKARERESEIEKVRERDNVGREKRKRGKKEREQGPTKKLQNKSVKTDLVQFTHKIKVWSGGRRTERDQGERERENKWGEGSECV